MCLMFYISVVLGGCSIRYIIRGDEIRWFGSFFDGPWIFLFAYLTLLEMKKLEMETSNRIDYFKNKQQQQKEWIEKSM